MRKITCTFTIVLFVALLLLTGCTGGNINSRDPQARQLYDKSVRLTREYIDSLHHAKDSAAIFRINREYDKAITNLNYDYPAETDFQISEGENDTLTSLNERYVHLRDSLLYRLAHPLPRDTVAPDTI